MIGYFWGLVVNLLNGFLFLFEFCSYVSVLWGVRGVEAGFESEVIGGFIEGVIRLFFN